MDLAIRPLRCFIAVVEDGAFTRAAQRMNISQPALSGQIRALEQALGFPLFIRTTRRVELTAKGAAFLPAARRMAAESDDLSRAVEILRGGAGQLKLAAAFYTLEVPDRVALVEGLMAAHPEIELQIDFRWQAEVTPDLLAGHVDLALVIGMPIPLAEHQRLVRLREPVENLYPRELTQVVVRREPVQLLVPVESPLAALESIPVRALRGIPVAALSPQHGARLIDPITALLLEAGAQPIVPPEPHGVGVERYGRQFRIPAVSLGWFDAFAHERTDMVRRPFQGLDLWTDLALIGAARSPTVSACIRFAQAFGDRS